MAGSYEQANESSGSIKAGECFNYLNGQQFLSGAHFQEEDSCSSGSHTLVCRRLLHLRSFKQILLILTERSAGLRIQAIKFYVPINCSLLRNVK